MKSKPVLAGEFHFHNEDGSISSIDRVKPRPELKVPEDFCDKLSTFSIAARQKASVHLTGQETFPDESVDQILVHVILEYAGEKLGCMCKHCHYMKIGFIVGKHKSYVSFRVFEQEHDPEKIQASFTVV